MIRNGLLENILVSLIMMVLYGQSNQFQQEYLKGILGHALSEMNTVILNVSISIRLRCNAFSGADATFRHGRDGLYQLEKMSILQTMSR
jgi:hypothetical protein